MEVPPVKCVHFRLGQYLQGRQSLFCPLTYSVRKDKTMTKKNVTVNYNGEPLKADEVLVFTPYDEEDVKNNVTNKESVVSRQRYSS